MLDPGFIRKNPDVVRKGLASKGDTSDLDWFLQRDKEYRAVVNEQQQSKARQNTLSPVIGQKKAKGEDCAAEMAEAESLKAKLKELDEKESVLKEDLRKLLLRMPNLPAPDVPVGRSSADNVVDATWGEPPAFEFKPRPHWEIGASLGVLHPETAGKLSGS